ncbi:MAG TPA: protein kinase [Fimbriiglobus sp.]|jgi:serine/threonine protein kinase
MTPCPPDDRLAALLDDTIDAAELATLDGHVTECVPCQNRLDRLTDAPELTDWLNTATNGSARYPFLSPPIRTGELGRLNGYAIRSEIGRGGMGLVLRGWDETLARDVAIKVLRPEDNDALGEAKFSREARAVARLRHDHVVPLFAVDRTSDGRPFLVMPFVPGHTLLERLRGGPISPRDAAEIVRQVADGLAAAHAAGLIHRDVKPANILLDAADGRAKLTDFGLVRTASDTETLSPDGILSGTPFYMSPEQAGTPERIDPRTDVYSLGITFYECMTGTVPFRGTPLAVIDLHRTVDPVPPRRLNADVSSDLETICLTAIAKNPADRYSSAAAFRDDLVRWLEGRPIHARPAGPLERVRRWCGRNPLPVAIIVVSIFGSVAAGTGWWRAGVKADDAARNAELARNREADANASRALAQEKAKLADERSALALGAITTLVTKAQTLADRSPGTLKLKRQLNEAALADLRKLADSTAKVPGVDRSIVLAHQKLGDALHLLGQTDEAFREWDRALAMAERILAADPNDVLTQRDAGRAHYTIGFTRNLLQDIPTATRHLNASVGIFEDLWKLHPDDRDVLQSLTAAYNGRSDVERNAGQTSAALTDSERSLALNQKLLDLDPTDLKVRAGLLFSHNRQAYTEIFLLHDYDAAERHFREELRLAAEQRTKTPEDPTWQRHYHICLLDLSSIQQRKGEFTAGEASARAALGWLGEAAKHDPDNVLAQRDYAMAVIHLGNVQLGQKKFDDAEKSFLQAMDVFDRVSARAKTVAVVAGDIPTLCIVLSGICERQDRYADAARWTDRIITSMKNISVNPGQASQTAALIQRLTNLRNAYLLTPKVLTNPEVIEAQTSEVAVLLSAIRARAMARRGDYPQALLEIRSLLEKHPTDSMLPLAQACIFGLAAGSVNENEKASLLEKGVASLIAAIRLDRVNLDLLHLTPELNEIRSFPSFRAQLRKMLDQPKPN